MYFATLFNKNYLSRGVVMFNSLQNVLNENLTLFVLCLDDDVCLWDWDKWYDAGKTLRKDHDRNWSFLIL